MIWENKLIRTENTRRKACNMMHIERWHEHITPANKGAGPKEKKNAADCLGYHPGTIQEPKENGKRVSKIWSYSTKASDTRQRLATPREDQLPLNMKNSWPPEEVEQKSGGFSIKGVLKFHQRHSNFPSFFFFFCNKSEKNKSLA
ncbi:hypothetical protein ACS0TY_023863 [Phlomoides rotata]